MNLKSLFLAASSLVIVFPVSAGEWMKKVMRYDLDGTTFESTVVYRAGGDDLRPGVLMVPNWMGPTEESLKKARSVAGDDFVVMMVDMYGVGVRPANGEEAGKAAGMVRADRGLMRARAAKALEVFRSEAGSIGLDPERIAAIGFCFGGGTVLELGRSGAELDAIVTFHADLASPTLEADAGATRAKVMVLHGADDPYVPQSDVQSWVAAMRATQVDWQLVQFSGTVHSFTDPLATATGQAEYNPVSSARAFEMMDELIEEIWGDPEDE
ncbi:MAG: dienelactone hydrolase family protein [Opitutaceae bacterium]